MEMERKYKNIVMKYRVFVPFIILIFIQMIYIFRMHLYKGQMSISDRKKNIIKSNKNNYNNPPYYGYLNVVRKRKIHKNLDYRTIIIIEMNINEENNKYVNILETFLRNHEKIIYFGNIFDYNKEFINKRYVKSTKFKSYQYIKHLSTCSKLAYSLINQYKRKRKLFPCLRKC